METELRTIRENLINKALFFGVLFIYPILCASIIRVYFLGWSSLFYFHIAFAISLTLLYILRKEILLETKVFLFSLVFYLFSFVGSLYFGLAAGLFFYVFVVIINTVILGQKKGIIALLAAFAGLVVAAVLHSSGLLKVITNLNAYTASYISWISYIVAFLFVFIVSILTIGVYIKFFLKNMEALRIKIAEHENTVDELTLAKAILEKQYKDLLQLNTQYLEAKNKAEESDKLKTAFLHNISHEIRTPMNAIMGFVEILNNPGLTEEKRNKYSAIVTMNCNHLLTTITDIVTISTLETQQEKVNLEQVHINHLLSDLMQIFEPQAKLKNLELKIKKA
ncbi:MAG TPA: histidine kinase dimerization/phospho-acceptor domain-containing protein [Bacteroidales bacterium]|nr:histidine kinase dimerization/phospho-acceptor domain-containing protein [Bacteroidales bacterium]